MVKMAQTYQLCEKRYDTVKCKENMCRKTTKEGKTKKKLETKHGGSNWVRKNNMSRRLTRSPHQWDEDWDIKMPDDVDLNKNDDYDTQINH